MLKKSFFLFFVFSLACCQDAGTNLTYETVAVTIHSDGKQHLIQAEIADTPEKQRLGLMNRHELAENAGMIFPYEKESRQSFWMKNTYISLDMIFISQAKEIVYIAHQTTPLSLEVISPEVSAQYVLEVAGGFAREKEIEVGHLVEFDL